MLKVRQSGFKKAVSEEVNCYGKQQSQLTCIRVDEKVLSLSPAETAMKYCVFPLGFSDTDEGELLVVTDDPETPGLAKELKRVTGKEIKLIIGVRDDIADRIKQYYI